jgi:hypothetical protein
MFDADVLLWNRTGAKAFTGATVDRVGLGGSELEVVQIAEALTDLGCKCVVCSGEYEPCEVRGVRYEPFDFVEKSRPRRRFRAVYLERWSPCPEVFAEKYVVRATDVASDPYAVHHRGLGQGWTELVCVTKWHARGFPFARHKHVIPPIMDGIPEMPAKDPNLFVYASAPSKGLPPSCSLWRQMKEKYPEAMGPLRLNVVLPGRSYTESPDLDTGDGGDIELVGTPTVEAYRMEIAKAAGLFYVSQFQETFCNAAAFAERFGGRAHVLALMGRCGMTEALAPWKPEADGGRFLTTDRETFERQFLEALADPPEAPVVVDRSRAALAPDWVRVLGL